ncbi:MAG: biopolymer transporter ExbD [Candidatus Eisenbacteria bacterium]|nr:biopolymer transporter ExbD [Candidatus Eisenbacteria bacterium]
MPARKPKRRIGIKIDMTPMVDIAFLLLIFFMATTQFKPAEEVQIVLPSSHSAIKVPESNVLILTITKDSRLFVSLNSLPAENITMGELANAVINARMRSPGLRFVVKTDKDAEYGTVIDVMDVLQETNTIRFNLVTELEVERMKI